MEPRWVCGGNIGSQVEHVQERHVLSCEEISLAHSALLHSCNVPANHIIDMAEGLYVISISYVTRKAPIEPFNQLQEASFFFQVLLMTVLYIGCVVMCRLKSNINSK